MKKLNTFSWAYNAQHNLRNDPVMTRSRLASMIMGWRKNKFQVTRTLNNGVHLIRVQTGGLTAYSECK